MSLDYSITNCAEGIELNPNFSDNLESLVFHMMFVGMNKLETRVQIETFYTRYNAYNLSFGRDLKNNFLSYADVVAFKGITANVSTKTDAAFKKECSERMMQWAWDMFNMQRKELGDY